MVAERAAGIYEYCRCPEAYSSTKFSIEHIIPRSKGGDDHQENLAFACQGCNNIKASKVIGINPESLEAIPLFNPRIHTWEEHFYWESSLTKLAGITPIGRATIKSFRLNREEVQNLRNILFLIGEHPR